MWISEYCAPPRALLGFAAASAALCCNETILDLAVGDLAGDDVLDVTTTTTDQPCIFLSDAP